jgi:GntR family transcriptional regulator
MEDIFDDNTPIYLQLVKLFTIRIAGGEWKAGDRVASVRDLAVMFKVNPNTVQRALAEMERDGLVFSERTSGRFITSEEGKIQRARSMLAEQEVAQFTLQMKQLGYGQKEWIALVENQMKKENN